MRMAKKDVVMSDKVISDKILNNIDQKIALTKVTKENIDRYILYLENKS